ncbi:sulfurtransferase TusA family protein [Thalassotalea atypica]|uniref:sulfurtransferase TusA family protein n=1 Tax=Thalassotalea atypica TaxID=2054316 RepID=UPI0025742EF4|nr:sulfurtransferase TusA family protein [Thalassotalea atypica]
MIYEYDATLDKCPLPLVKLRVVLKKMAAKDSCIIRLADSGSKSDIPKLLYKQQYPFTTKQLSNNVVELHIYNR